MFQNLKFVGVKKRCEIASKRCEIVVVEDFSNENTCKPVIAAHY